MRTSPLTSKHLVKFPLGWIWNGLASMSEGRGDAVIVEVGKFVEGGTTVTVEGVEKDMPTTGERADVTTGVTGVQCTSSTNL